MESSELEVVFTTLGVVVTCAPLVLLDGCKSVLFSAIGASVMKIEVKVTLLHLQT